MIEHKDYSTLQTWDDVIRHRVRLPGYYDAWAAKYLDEKAPNEFDVEPVGVDGRGQRVYVLFWHPPMTAIQMLT